MHRLVIEVSWAAGAWQLDISKRLRCVAIEIIIDSFNLFLAPVQGYLCSVFTGFVCRRLKGVVAVAIRRNDWLCREPEHSFTCSIQLAIEPFTKPKQSSQRLISLIFLAVLNRSISYAVSSRSLIVEARVQFQASQCGIVNRVSVGEVFLRETRGFPVATIPPLSL